MQAQVAKTASRPTGSRLWSLRPSAGPGSQAHIQAKAGPGPDSQAHIQAQVGPGLSSRARIRAQTSPSICTNSSERSDRTKDVQKPIERHGPAQPRHRRPVPPYLNCTPSAVRRSLRSKAWGAIEIRLERKSRRNIKE